MTRRELALTAIGTLAGVLVASAAWSVQNPSPRVAKVVAASKDGDDLATLRAANDNLVESLRNADMTIAQLRAQLGMAPAPSATVMLDGGAPATPRGRRPGRSGRGEPTAEELERMAKEGTVRVRVPCMRDTPWTPDRQVLTRLGLAPDDAATIRDAYARSNKRLVEQIKPLCVKAVGADAAGRLDPKACTDVILSSAKRTDPEGMQRSLMRVAEINAGKDVKPGGGGGAGADAEQLLLAMSKESKAFEADLAARYGPDEAKRLAWAPEMCNERTFLRAREDGADTP